jgi:Fanconi anemia group J protein
MASSARSVILTSGTMSPLDTFASELGATFPHTVEANHVIKPQQMWAGTVSRSLGGRNIQLT